MNYITKFDHGYYIYSGCGLQYMNVNQPKGMTWAHYHDDYELYFLVNGSRKYFLASKICTIQPNQVILIKPKEPHQVTINLNIPYERYVLYITPQLLSKIRKENPSLKNIYETEIFSLPEDVFNHAISLIKKIEEETNRNDTYSPDVIKNIIVELLFLIVRNNDASKHTIDKGDIRLQSSINYILENYYEQITLNDCAEIASMNPSQFSRTFHKTTAMTFKEFLNKTRIDAACELLKSTSESIVQIALEVGFSSESHFASVFKSIKNISPSSYRKQFTKIK